MKKTFLFLTGLIFLFLASCHKEQPEELPLQPISENFKISFSCILDGEIWKPEGAHLQNLQAYQLYNEANGQFMVRANREVLEDNKIQVSETICISQFTDGPGSYTPSPEVSYYADKLHCGKYFLLSPAGSKLQLTKIDTIENLIAGTFSFQLFHEECGDTIQVEGGRFEGKYIPY